MTTKQWQASLRGIVRQKGYMRRCENCRWEAYDPREDFEAKEPCSGCQVFYGLWLDGVVSWGMQHAGPIPLTSRAGDISL